MRNNNVVYNHEVPAISHVKIQKKSILASPLLWRYSLSVWFRYILFSLEKYNA